MFMVLGMKDSGAQAKKQGSSLDRLIHFWKSDRSDSNLKR